MLLNCCFADVLVFLRYVVNVLLRCCGVVVLFCWLCFLLLLLLWCNGAALLRVCGIALL